MRYELLVGIRYLLSKRRERFISVIGFISVAGVAIGVCALIVVIGVMAGFDNDLREKIIGTNAHLVIEKEGGIDNVREVIARAKNNAHVIAASPFLDAQAVLKSATGTQGVLVRGISPEEAVKVTKLGDYIKSGSCRDIKDDGILIGSEMASRWGLKLKDTVSVISPLTGESMDFNIAGIFNSGMYEYDLNLAFVDLTNARALFGADAEAGGIEVKLDNVYLARDVKTALQKEFGFPYWVRTWMDLNRSLFSALKLEKMAMFVILTLIVVVACFNIVSTLIMVVVDKTKDIGVLKSIGASNSSIMAIFTLEGFIIGALGTGLGVAGGLGISYLLGKYQFIKLPRDIYYIDRFPVEVQAADTLIIVAAALVISLLSCLYPAWKASSLNPVEALRYE